MKQSNGPRELHNLPSSEINWASYEPKNYLHFDRRIDVEYMKSKVQDKQWITSYAFLPSLHFDITFNKYVTVKRANEKGIIIKQKEKKKKVRKIFYAAHKDSYIYKYYGDVLNNAYNEYATKTRIDNIAVAYRNNKKGKNSADFAFEVFNHMFNFEQAVVISMDFTSFFDKISHKKLKQNIKRVLGQETLPEDWYKVFRNLTKYTYIEKNATEDFLKKKYGIKKRKKVHLSRIMEPHEFRDFKRCHIQINKNEYGIPQGSGMSAVCSNVHLIDFDRELAQWAKQKHPNALYRRYCDDLILIIPVSNDGEGSFHEIKKEIIGIVEKYKEDGLIIQDEKTEMRLYKNKSILNENMEAATLDYLGFVTDGRFMRIREKSLFKYYTRAYRKAKTSRRISYATKRPGPRKELYDLYTHLGYDYKYYGNFISYAYKAHALMNNLPTNSLIRKQIKRHWYKVHKRATTRYDS
ncbi:reverse transcriptase [Terribacillus saccharophilus]|uniref:Reverse transcriptase n=1 Tax=Terribacillus saccharophilus TaxID=361277 RepID=A0A075LFM4_9BACI|nr:reverse transcriptase domain-containing protein [Terribacillus goriensis]AIF65229.1 reverse transcriptase [Terribacillus goriensis]